MNYSVQLQQTGEGEFFHVYGVNFGYSNGSMLKIIHKDDPYYIVRVKGGSDWYARGETKYYGASYYVWKRVCKEVKGKYKVEYWQMETLAEKEVGRKWKAALNELIQKIEEVKNVTAKKQKK